MLRTRAIASLLAGLSMAGAAEAAPPAVPLGVTAEASAPGEVSLTWLPSAGADEYRVYRRVDPLIQFVGPPLLQWQFLPPVPAPVATVTGTSYTDTGLPPLVRQFYVVTAVNADGESPLGLLATQREVRVTAPPDAEVFGFADLHSHQFANLGFGGKVVFGDAFASDGLVETALPVCNAVHGFAGLSDVVGTALRERVGHNTGGYPHFDGWPGWRDYTHQQVYVDWLKRAYDGGLRLMVMTAVNNKVLCGINGPAPGFTCDDMDAVDRQLMAAKELEAFLDTQAGGPGKGWYRIAYSATQARELINAGKLAVVLGMEVDEPFGCGVLAPCPAGDLDDALTNYHAAGVRHFFPVHVIDNAFGGAAMYEPLFNYANKLVTTTFFDQRDCGAEGFRYKTGSPSALMTIAGLLAGTGTAPTTSFLGDCNNADLSMLGGDVIRGLMRRKMIVDVDHMSADTAAGVFALAEPQHYPLVSSHTGVLGATLGARRHEGLRTPSQLQRLNALGGMVATAVHQGTNAEVDYPPSGLANNCSNSTRTFAQAYMAAVDAMGGPATAAVGLGTDFNGLAKTVGPRFGADACTGNAGGPTPQGGKLAYPFAIQPPPGVTNAGSLGRMGLANRHYRDESNQALPGFDYNFDGLAHAGLLPDFLADLRLLVPAAYMQPLFRSAEGYLRTWEAIERTQVFPPTIALATVPATPASGWFASDPTVRMTGTPHANGGPIDAIVYSAAGAQVVPETEAPASPADLVVTAEGTTTVTAVARDDFGSRSLPGTLEVRLDKTGPSAECDLANGLWHADNVSLPCTASDALSGLADPADASFALATSVPAGAETADAATGTRDLADVAGNVATAGPITGNKVDRKAPAIAVTVPAASAVYAINQSVAAAYDCVDGGSGLVSCVGTAAAGAPIDTSSPGAKTFTVDAADDVGHTSAASVSYVVAYNVCLLYDPTRVKKAGSTVPIKLQACDAGGANLSGPGLVVTATAVTQTSTNTSGIPEDAGNANPDLDFRYDASLPGYVFNLQTAGLAAGTWELRFRIAGDPTEHGAGFQIR